jgi:hypothetical protein
MLASFVHLLATAAPDGPAPDALGGSWRLTFEDDFNGTELNTSRWNLPNGGIHGNELELYTAGEVSVRDGKLTIRSRYNPTRCEPQKAGRTRTLGRRRPLMGHPSDGHGWCLPAANGSRLYNFTSGWLDTEALFAQRFGRFTVRAKLPDVDALSAWPAHWLLPDITSDGCKRDLASCAWPVGGEIDIMESWGKHLDFDGNVFGTYHWATKPGEDLHCGGTTPERRCAPYNFSGRYPGAGLPADFSKSFHEFSVVWNESSIVWSVDGNQYWERHNGDRPGTGHSAQIRSHQMYLILNTAISANKPAVPPHPPHYPVSHEIDWVRVWEWVPSSSTTVRET